MFKHSQRRTDDVILVQFQGKDVRRSDCRYRQGELPRTADSLSRTDFETGCLGPTFPEEEDNSMSKPAYMPALKTDLMGEAGPS